MRHLTRRDLSKRLLALWKPQRWQNPPYRLGIAVSGGADSMALALLCKQLQDRNPSFLNFKAFVVDHQARPDSSAEAEGVANRLKQLGLDTEVRTVAWPSNTSPREIKSFESQARRLRFQALGRASLESRIQGLLLGHHKDDQAETVLMRILAGYLGLGLQGIKPISGFPECNGLFGVHQDAGALGDAVEAEHTSSEPSTLHSASAGLSVFRPLLDVPKESLIATCKHSNVSWVEDPTNQDPTLTLRNSVRSLLKDGAKLLPTALNDRHLVELALLKQGRHTSQNNHAIGLLRNLDICELDKRAGRLVFEISEEGEFSRGLRQIQGNEETNKVSSQALFLAGHIAALVSPFESIPMSASQLIAEKIFRSILDQDLQAGNITTPSFTAAGLHWVCNKKWSSSQSYNYSWDVTRQPLGRTENMPLCEWRRTGIHDDSNFNVNYAPPFGTWQLFDGRFWLRVLSAHYETLQARLLREQDVREFLSAFDGNNQERIRALFKRVAPGKARWSLPVLIETGNRRVLAIPTLGIQLPETKMNLALEVKYKKIHLGTSTRGDTIESVEMPSHPKRGNTIMWKS